MSMTDNADNADDRDSADDRANAANAANAYRVVHMKVQRRRTVANDAPCDYADGDVIDDAVATEEPLEIRLAHGPLAGPDGPDGGPRAASSISITMRTPGHDAELALGFLVSEGIVRRDTQVVRVAHCGPPPRESATNVIKVELAADVVVDMQRLQRNVYTTSSCGVCGKGSLDALAVTAPPTLPPDTPRVSAATIAALPDRLSAAQTVFARTGGLHAAALFRPDGELLAVMEDVGRHNAVDKLVGQQLQLGNPPLHSLGLLLSGRASFELLQKALMAGIPFVAAVGAPSSLAVELAITHGITLCGFVRNGRFNIYCGDHRVTD